MPHQSNPPVMLLDHYLRVASGKATGISAALARLGLSLASIPYGMAVCARNAAYNTRLLKSHHVSVPVVSLGNLTTGGTGKTPLAAFLAEWFQQRGLKPAFLSRGYHSGPDQKNDEALVLEKICPGVQHVQQPDRVAGAATAIMSGAEVLILDDGFQHRRLQRDLNILLVDAVQPWGYGSLLPRGLLREPLSSARRADLVLITRANLVSERQLHEIENRLLQSCCRAPFVHIAFLPDRLLNSAGEMLPREMLLGKKLALFCGLGNPEGFRETVKSTGIDDSCISLRSFPDHHHYSPGDLSAIADWGCFGKCDLFLTTLKDLVKIRRNELNGIPLWALGIRPRILQGEEHFDRLLNGVVKLAHQKES